MAWVESSKIPKKKKVKSKHVKAQEACLKSFANFPLQDSFKSHAQLQRTPPGGARQSVARASLRVPLLGPTSAKIPSPFKVGRTSRDNAIKASVWGSPVRVPSRKASSRVASIVRDTPQYDYVALDN